MSKLKVASRKGQRLKTVLRSAQFRDELRDVLTCYDLELLFDEPSITPDPRKYVALGADARGEECFVIRFRPFEWVARRAPEDRTEERRKDLIRLRAKRAAKKAAKGGG